MAAIDLPVEHLFPIIKDIAFVGTPAYLNESLNTRPTDIVRIPITTTGPNPELQFFLPRLRVLYTDRGFNELSVAPTIFWACEAAAEVINALKSQCI